MTPRQKAIAALLAAAAAGGGSVAPDTLRSILSATCGTPEAKLERLLPSGEKETTITVKRAVNILGQACEENAAGVADEVEIKLIQPNGGK